MTQNKLMFKDVTNYSSFLEKLNQVIEPIHERRFFPHTLSEAKKVLTTADEQMQTAIMSFAHHVDKKMNEQNQVKCNAFIKVPTVISGALYIGMYPDISKNLSEDELETLSLYSATMPLWFYKNANQLFPKQLLTVINQKIDDHGERQYVMFIADKHLQLKKTPEQVIAYFKDLTFDDILAEYIEDAIKEEKLALSSAKTRK